MPNRQKWIYALIIPYLAMLLWVTSRVYREQKAKIYFKNWLSCEGSPEPDDECECKEECSWYTDSSDSFLKTLMGLPTFVLTSICFKWAMRLARFFGEKIKSCSARILPALALFCVNAGFAFLLPLEGSYWGKKDGKYCALGSKPQPGVVPSCCHRPYVKDPHYNNLALGRGFIDGRFWYVNACF